MLTVPLTVPLTFPLLPVVVCCGDWRVLRTGFGGCAAEGLWRLFSEVQTSHLWKALVQEDFRSVLLLIHKLGFVMSCHGVAWRVGSGRAASPTSSLSGRGCV